MIEVTNNGWQMPVGEAWGFLRDNEFKLLHIADVAMTRSQGLLGDVLCFGQSMKGDPARFNHVWGYTGNGQCLEALTHVIERPASVYFRSAVKMKIVRHMRLNENDRARILFQAKKYKGMPYAWGKVVILQLFDCAFRTDMFTRHFSITRLPYCSQMWADAYMKAGTLWEINNLRDPNSIVPDDWDDEVTKYPELWATVLEHDGKVCKVYDLSRWRAAA